MYRGFDVALDTGWFDQWQDAHVVGQEIFEANKKTARQSLDSLRNSSGDIVADEIMAEWFPDVKPHVFISHSHQDSAQAITMAGWLRRQFGLTAFVDSCVWGCADELLAEIDMRYCYQTSKGTYDYQMRNKSTAHVHIMLNSALMRLVNSSECMFFINTPNSISTQTYIKSAQTTDSPWLFSELTISKLIQRRVPSEHRGGKLILKSARTFDAAMESLDVQYPADTRHLTRLAATDLAEWYKKVPQRPADPTTALDVLYKLTPLKSHY